MTSAELKRWLKKQGCWFSAQGKSGHVTVHRGRLKSILPMHGKHRDLGTGLVDAIKRDLGLK